MADLVVSPPTAHGRRPKIRGRSGGRSCGRSVSSSRLVGDFLAAFVILVLAVVAKRAHDSKDRDRKNERDAAPVAIEERLRARAAELGNDPETVVWAAETGRAVADGTFQGEWWGPEDIRKRLAAVDAATGTR